MIVKTQYVFIILSLIFNVCNSIDIFNNLDFISFREYLNTSDQCFKTPIALPDYSKSNDEIEEISLEKTHSITFDEKDKIACKCQSKGFFTNLFNSEASKIIQSDYIHTIYSHIRDGIIYADYIIITELNRRTFKLYSNKAKCIGNQVYSYRGRSYLLDNKYAYIHYNINFEKEHLSSFFNIINVLTKIDLELESSLRKDGFTIIDSNLKYVFEELNSLS